MGNRSSREVSSAAPKTTSGTVVARPITSSQKLTSPPILAAPTRAITLSSDMTASATMMILIACHALWPASILSSPSSGSSWTSFQAIQISNSPPATCKKGISSRKAIMAAKTSRSATAPTAPQMIAWRRWEPWRLRAAMAMTTALSPERMRFTANTLSSASQKSASNNVGSSYAAPRSHTPGARLLVRAIPDSSYQYPDPSIEPILKKSKESHNEEHGVERPPNQQILALDRLFPPSQQVEVHTTHERQRRGERVERIEAPAREREAQGHRYRALEDHRPGYVPQSQRVLVAPEPDDGVELLG